MAEHFAAVGAHAVDGVMVNRDIHVDSESRAAMAITYATWTIASALGRLG